MQEMPREKVICEVTFQDRQAMQPGDVVVFRKGDTMASRKDAWSSRDVWDYIVPEPNTGCWIWLGALTSENGYGTMGSWGVAYRFVYRTLVGPIPDGMELDHKCEMKCCVNPDHLQIVTHKQNMENWARRKRNRKIRERKQLPYRFNLLGFQALIGAGLAARRLRRNW